MAKEKLIKTIAEIENSFLCRFCHASLLSTEYRFCDSEVCQSLYYKLIERKISMRHKFSFNLQTSMCNVCNLNMESHTALARCSKCSKQTECDLIDGLLICVICEPEYLISRKAISESGAALDVITNIDKLSPQELLNKAREIDSSVRYHGDYFNLETISISQIKKAIYENELIPEEDKAREYTNALANRVFHFQQVLIENNEKNFQLYQQIAADKNELRQFGQDITKEIREKLKASDTMYEVKMPKVVKPRIAKQKKEKKHPREMLIESIMAMRNCTREKALQIIVSNDMYKNADVEE